MHFNIDADNGDIIKGWLAPDNPQSPARVVVVTPGLPEIVVEATIVRPDIVNLGVHPTGKCGFQITPENVPGLSERNELQLLEADSRLPIHGRFVQGLHLEKKLYLFDCSIAPQRRIFERMKSHFSLGYNNCERFGLETTLSVISNHFTQSIFLSGRSHFLRYDHFLKDKGYVRAAI
ncbi:MAG: hypothetical protein N2444_08145, partial [Methylocystis sp.]|nr:hypothetical protein [Methylocystis sp.]